MERNALFALARYYLLADLGVNTKLEKINELCQNVSDL